MRLHFQKDTKGNYKLQEQKKYIIEEKIELR